MTVIANDDFLKKLDEYTHTINVKLMSYYGNELDTLISLKPELLNYEKKTVEDGLMKFMLVNNILWFASAYQDYAFQFPVVDIEQEHLLLIWPRMPNGRCQVICITNTPFCEAEFFSAETGEKKNVKFDPQTIEVLGFCNKFIDEMRPNKEKDALKKLKN